jgi:patatin-like phospholipase/acyl hydrolase
MRGLYAATYLARLEAIFSSKRDGESLDIGKAFDLITGTSTGAIMACALAYGVGPAEIAKLYKDNAKAIFPKPVPNKINFSFCAQLKTRTRLILQGEAALQSALTKIFGKTTFGDIYQSREIALRNVSMTLRHLSSAFSVLSPRLPGPALVC